MKYIKLLSEYGCESPLFADGGDWEPGRCVIIQLDELPISSSLKSELEEYHKWKKYEWDIIELGLKGNWSSYTKEEFEVARVELDIPPFPTYEEFQSQKESLIRKLQDELPKDEYSVVEKQPLSKGVR